MITQTYNLNLIPGGVPVRVPCSQRDAGSRTIVFKLYNGSEEFTNSGVTGRIDGTRADGVAFQTAATISNGAATWVISLDMTATAGEHKAELIITDTGGNVLGTANFVIAVEAEAKSPNADPTTEETTLWEQMYNQTAELTSSARESASSAADSAAAASDAAESAQNAVQAAIDAADAAPTNGSANIVTSGGVFAALADKLDSAKVVNNATTTDAGYALDARQGKALDEKIDAQTGFDVLWENSDPGSAFPAQSITVDLTDYDFIAIVARYSASDNRTVTCLGYLWQDEIIMMLNIITRTVGMYRSATVTKSTGVIVFDDGTTSSASTSSVMIPVCVLGVKI